MTIEKMLETLEFKELSLIQQKVIESFDKANHIAGLAPTGTGKTHAYLFPLLSRLKRVPNEVEAIILLPTNELVNQVAQMIEKTDPEVFFKSYFGSLDMEREATRLKNQHPNLIVTTPSKLIDLVIHKNALNIKHIKYFVLDEADMMFDEDFMSMIDPVLVNQNVEKFLLFSASITRSMEPFIRKYFGQHLLIDTTKHVELKIKYKLLKVNEQRINQLSELLDHLNPYLCIIFVSKNEDIQRVYE